RQGCPRILGVPRGTGSHHVRGRWRASRSGARGADAGRGEAADTDEIRGADRRRVMAKGAVNKATDVRAKTPDELSTLLLDLRKEQFNLRFQRATGQQEGTGRIREVRREIARIKTIQAERTRTAVAQ